MCENAFANVTDEFEWVSAGILTELRAIIITLEAEFDMAALDRHFELVNNAAAKVLAPLEARSKELAAIHEKKLAKLQRLVNSGESTRNLAQSELAATQKHSAKEAWRGASEPLRIELTTIGTTIALLVGMVVANLVHGRKGIVSSARQAAHERSRLISGRQSGAASSTIRKSYGGFE
jgi:hypothetical protein